MKYLKFYIIPVILFLMSPVVMGQTINNQTSNPTQVTNEINEKELEQFLVNIQSDIGSSFEDKSLVLENKMILEEITLAVNKNLITEKENPKISKFLTEKLKLAYKNKIIKEIQKEIQRQEAKGLPVYIVQPGDKLSLLAEALNVEPLFIISENNLSQMGQLQINYSQLFTKEFYLIEPLKKFNVEKDTLPQDSEQLDKDFILIPGDILVGIFSSHNNAILGSMTETQGQESYTYNGDDDTQEEISQVDNSESSNSTSLFHAKESAKNQIIGLNITRDQYNELVMQIEEATDLTTIENIINWAKELAKKNDQVNDTELQSQKDNAISLISSYNLAEEQVNEVINMINSATTVEEVNNAIAYAESLISNP